MGRLPKKKTAAKKKKKTSPDVPAEVARNGADTATADPQPAPAAAPREIKKRSTGLPKKPAAPVKAASGDPNFLQKAIQFLREVKVELKKVTWPSRKQTIGSTIVVLILTMIISLFLGVVDMGLSGLVRVVLQ